MREKNVDTITVTAPKVAFPFSLMRETAAPTDPPGDTVGASWVINSMHTDDSSYTSTVKIGEGGAITIIALGTIMVEGLFERHFVGSGSFVPASDPAPVVKPVGKRVGVTPVVATIRLAFDPDRTVGVTGVEVRELTPLGSAPLQVRSAITDSLSLSFLESECSLEGTLVTGVFQLSTFVAVSSLWFNWSRRSNSTMDLSRRRGPWVSTAVRCKGPSKTQCSR